jgi:hypothetical protein
MMWNDMGGGDIDDWWDLVGQRLFLNPPWKRLGFKVLGLLASR